MFLHIFNNVHKLRFLIKINVFLKFPKTLLFSTFYQNFHCLINIFFYLHILHSNRKRYYSTEIYFVFKCLIIHHFFTCHQHYYIIIQNAKKTAFFNKYKLCLNVAAIYPFFHISLKFTNIVHCFIKIFFYKFFTMIKRQFVIRLNILQLL